MTSHLLGEALLEVRAQEGVVLQEGRPHLSVL